MSVITLVNGEPMGVDPADRGLAYGDGLFETMACRRGRIRWLDHHLDRLLHGCARLAIPPPPRAGLVEEIHGALSRAGQGDAVVKLTVTRGVSTRGYRAPDVPVPARILSIGPWPAVPPDHYTDGIAVRTCTLRLGENPQLAGLKHLCRLEQVLAQMELAGRDLQEGILRSRSGAIISGIACNVFAVVGGRLLTPRIADCGVAGVMRRVVLDYAGAAGIEPGERVIVPGELAAAEEIFVTNAVLGIRPVRELDGRRVEVGPITRRLQAAIGDGPDA